MTDLEPTDAGTCRNCGGKLLFAPYYLDGKQPNPPRWFHATGTFTCPTLPPNWAGPWPTAQPVAGLATDLNTGQRYRTQHLTDEEAHRIAEEADT